MKNWPKNLSLLDRSLYTKKSHYLKAKTKWGRAYEDRGAKSSPICCNTPADFADPWPVCGQMATSSEQFLLSHCFVRLSKKLCYLTFWFRRFFCWFFALTTWFLEIWFNWLINWFYLLWFFLICPDFLFELILN